MIVYSELKDQALASLQGRWGLAIGGFFVSNLVIFISQGLPIVGFVAGLVIGGPIYLGQTIFSLKLARNQETVFEEVFDGFKDFGRSLGAYLMMILYIFLWALLLIIPGIIKALAYSQTFFILAENPEMHGEEAINKSMEMMDGYKTDYFVLGLTFIGWTLLCLLTLGIGFLWLIPYMRVTYANFYLQLKGDEPLELESADIIVEEL